MTNLSVNVNKIAWLRNARGEGRPDIIELSKILINCGIQGLTVHPRPDLRHITPDDVYDISSLCKESNVEFNIEGNPYSEPTEIYPGFVNLVKEIEPDQCTLVPDSPEQITSDHGWQIKDNDLENIKEIVNTLKTTKTRISFFVDPDTFHIDQIKLTGADRIELYTGPYAVNPTLEVVSQYEEAFNHAKDIGLGVNAGHDLDLNNLQLFLSKVPADEVSIGHALISDALINGLEVVTKQYLDLCK
ncbi:MAG: pyridoxine 5'-phosphate synthase [Pseudomonadota bacterium]|nr:pyridoxine 5'-phosphate synthase [Pseudomonadota bacterium]URQ67332.1 pyridoxine 5'-phosphate synthase [SAR86 cluster bacterium]|tara:strand:- start:1313 stop:2047 length:735 start_codon:yes stop_codon:yes gene_type:complete